MEVYDDRPVSFYDNLKAPTNTNNNTSKANNTAIARNNTTTATTTTTSYTTPEPNVIYSTLVKPFATATVASSPQTAAAATATPNGAIRSPIYADISFDFDDNQLQLKQQQQQQQQQRQLHSQPQQHKSELQPTQLLSYNHNQRSQPLSQQQQVHSSYDGSKTSANNNHIAQQQQQYNNTNSNSQSHTQAAFQPTPLAAKTVTMPTPATATATAMPSSTSSPTPSSTAASAAAARNASPAQRPLSQHSQSELYEASQSIAAVKAALNDAKSKFFGLNGYTTTDNSNNNSNNSNNATQHTNNANNESQPRSARQNATPRLHIDKQFPQIQIVTTAPTPPPKPQPKYQNIPENSAIFRRELPPELPPKPVDVIATPVRFTTTTPSPTSAPALSLPMTSTSSTTATATPSLSGTPMSTSQQQSPSTASSSAVSPLVATHSKVLPHHSAAAAAAAAYKQIPLNDIDTAQPSQAVYMSTTVPQNIKGSKIAGRHTPTRNSLRHSRMLVVNNKTYPGTQHPNPMNFKYPNLARWLLILEIIVGLLISFLAIWIFFLAPNSAIQDNPYWSGLVLLLAGLIGLVLVRYQRIKRHKVRENCFIFLRADSYLLALLAALLCCIALSCAAIHYARLSAYDTRCVSTNILLEHGSCTCTFNANDAAPTTNSSAVELANGLFDEEVVPEHFEDRSYKVEYRDLSCKEVKGAWLTVLTLSMALNSLGLVLSFIYIILLVCYRHNSKRFYTSVHTSTF